MITALKCPNCGGEVELDSKMKQGFCVFCGSKIYNEQKLPETVNVTNIIMEPNSFYASFCYKGRQNEYLIKNELAVTGDYRKDAVQGDRNPIQITAKNDGTPMDVSMPCNNSGFGKFQITCVNKKLTLNCDHNIKLFLNGDKLMSSRCELSSGDLIRVGNIIVRVQDS